MEKQINRTKESSLSFDMCGGTCKSALKCDLHFLG